MSEVVYTLIRYALTAGGASVVSVSDDTTTQIATGIVALLGVIASYWREKAVSKGTK
jgi:hypothetical protein